MIKTIGDLMALLIVAPIILLMIYGAYLFLKDKEGRDKLKKEFDLLESGRIMGTPITGAFILLGITAFILGVSSGDMELTTNIWKFTIPATVLAVFYETILKKNIEKENKDAISEVEE